MKKLRYILVLIFLSTISNSQAQNNIISIRDNTPSKKHLGSYIKDIYGDFDQYLGTWIWQDGNNKVTFIIKKITQKYIQRCSCYCDLMVADYVYTTDNDFSNIVDTRLISQNSTNPDDYQMLTIDANLNYVKFVFKDIGINKHQTGFSSATFYKMTGFTNQMTLVLENPNTPQMILPGEPSPNLNFSLPNNIIVTKQP